MSCDLSSLISADAFGFLRLLIRSSYLSFSSSIFTACTSTAAYCSSRISFSFLIKISLSCLLSKAILSSRFFLSFLSSFTGSKRVSKDIVKPDNIDSKVKKHIENRNIEGPIFVINFLEYIIPWVTGIFKSSVNATAIQTNKPSARGIISLMLSSENVSTSILAEVITKAEKRPNKQKQTSKIHAVVIK